MAEPLLFDQRFEELLRELAADPRSSLLRVPRPARLQAVLGRSALVGLATAGWSATELELVISHREELARLLRQLAVALLHESPAAATNHLRHSSTRAAPNIETPDEWRERARIASAADLDAPGSREHALLQRLFDARAEFQRLDIEEVLAAAAKLQPTDEGRILLAQHRIAAGRLDSGATLLESVVNGPASAICRATAIANKGWLASRRGSSAEAASLYETAARERPEITAATTGWFSTALDAADRARALEAAQWLNAQVSATHPVVHEYAELMRAQFESEVAVRSAASVRLALDLQHALDGAARTIAHAYTK